MAAVCGASASCDSVRRALWLPRRPDARQTLRTVLQSAGRRGTLAFTQHDGYVLVHGASAPDCEREWRAFSADRCRVFAVHVPRNARGLRWALYEEGRRSRLCDERAGVDEGTRRPFEPDPATTPDGAERARSLYAALTDHQPGDDLDLEAEVDVWFVPD